MKGKAHLSIDMLPILVEQQSYFVASVMEGKHGRAMELANNKLVGWKYMANTPRSVTVTGKYEIMMTPKGASCSCPSFEWAVKRGDPPTCKHLQAAVLLLLDSGISFK